jgi:hypothetical protein
MEYGNEEWRKNLSAEANLKIEAIRQTYKQQEMAWMAFCYAVDNNSLKTPEAFVFDFEASARSYIKLLMEE